MKGFGLPETVTVKNNGADDFSSRYDGFDFTLKAGDSMEMPVGCAALCFGYGEEDKIPAVRRAGWVQRSDDMPAAMERLKQFSFHSSAPVGREGQAEPASAGAAESIKGTLHVPNKTKVAA